MMQQSFDFIQNHFWQLAFGFWFLVTSLALSAILDQMRSSTAKIVLAINELEIALTPRDSSHYWHEP
jgi:hypothetical protein